MESKKNCFTTTPKNTIIFRYVFHELFQLWRLLIHSKPLIMRNTIMEVIPCYAWVIIIISVGAFSFSCSEKMQDKDWNVYGGSNDQLKYSELSQIDSNNVHNLK